MANINGIIGYNRSGSSVNKLLAAYGNDIIDVATGLGYQLNLTSANNVEFEVFLDRIFYQNYAETPMTLNGSASKWTKEYVKRTMISKYIKNYKEKARLLLANCKFDNPQAPLDADGNAITFPSKVFFPDVFYGNTLTWGIEWGRNGKTQAGSPFFNLDQPLVQDFVANNIKVGDPLFITSGNSQLITKPYFVQSIESNLRLRMTENFPVTASSLHFWVGSNWFDVATDDNDQLTGIGFNSTRALLFKLMSLWYYTGNQLRQVKDAVGTSSHRSIISKGGYTYYFHGSSPLKTGIYRYDGVSSVRISRAIEPFIRGMSADNYDSVVVWEEGDELRFYLGDLSNSNYDISMSNAVATYHTGIGVWDVSPIADVITCAATYRTSNREDTYCGTSDDEVLQMADGNSHNGAAIRMLLETKVYYPAGTDVLNEFPRIQVIGRKTNNIKVKYKLWNKPNLVDDKWQPLGELSTDKTEIELPLKNNLASGIQLQFSELGILENDTYLEKISIFYKSKQVRVTQ
jgi:hypothetical protein